jgi:mono/diheme cytochrome c family protein
MKQLILCAASLTALSGAAFAGDVEAGRRLAELRCAACHIVGPGPRDELAESPPFDVIARKFGGNTDALAFNLVGPHARMNFSLTPTDAANVAEYIVSLVQ